MFRLLASITCAALLTFSLRAEETPTAQESPAIVGHWVVIKAQAGDKPVELRQAMVFKPNSEMNLIDRNLGKQSLFRYELDTQSSPQRIALTYLGPDERMKDLRQLGIWKMENDSLNLLLGAPKTTDQTKEDIYPTDLAKPSDTELLLTFEKVIFE